MLTLIKGFSNQEIRLDESKSHKNEQINEPLGEQF